MLALRYNEVPNVKMGASIEEAMEVMITRHSFILQVTDEKGKPAGWVNSLDILRAFKEDPGASEAKKRSIEELMHAVSEEDCLDVTGELAYIGSWLEKRG